MKALIFYSLAFLAIFFSGVLYYHNSVFVINGPENGFLLTKTTATRYSPYLPAFYVHILTGSIVLMFGIFQFSKQLRKNYPVWHRRAGKIYATVILLFTAPSGFVMSLYANGGMAAGIGFGVLAMLWWLFTWQGFRMALQKRWDVHREFMLRSYALTFAAVTLRLYSFIFALAGYRGETVYIIIAWLSWVPSIIVAEIYIRRKSLHRVSIS